MRNITPPHSSAAPVSRPREPELTGEQWIRAVGADLLLKLPQSGAIAPEHRERWLGQVAANALRLGQSVAEVKGIVRELGGIRDTEIFAFVAAHRGVPSPGMTSRSIVARKLLFEPPAGLVAGRGRLENALPWLRDMFEEAVPFVRHLADEARDLAWVRSREAYWACGSASDLYSSAAHDTFVGFYVADDYALAGLREDGEIPLQWQCEANYRAWLAEGKLRRQVGRVTYMVFDPNEFVFETVERPVDRELQQEMLSVGQRAWTDHVLRGELPSIAEKIEVSPDAYGAQAQKLALDYAGLRVLSALAKDRSDVAGKALAALIKERGPIGDAKVDFGLTAVTAQQRPDMEAMAARLLVSGGDPEGCRQVEVDASAAMGLAHELNRHLQAAGASSGGEQGAVDARRAAVEVVLMGVEPGAGINLTKRVGYDTARLEAALRVADIDPSQFGNEVLTVALPKGASASFSDLKDRVGVLLDGMINKIVSAVAAAQAAATAAPLAVAPTAEGRASARPEAASPKRGRKP